MQGVIHQAGYGALAEAVVRQAALDARLEKHREEAQALLADLLRGLGLQSHLRRFEQ